MQREGELIHGSMSAHSCPEWAHSLGQKTKHVCTKTKTFQCKHDRLFNLPDFSRRSLSTWTVDPTAYLMSCLRAYVQYGWHILFMCFSNYCNLNYLRVRITLQWYFPSIGTLLVHCRMIKWFAKWQNTRKKYKKKIKGVISLIMIKKIKPVNKNGW